MSDDVRHPYGVSPRKVSKPWGWELVWAETEVYVGKLLFVKAGHALSLQYHEVRDESARARLQRLSWEMWGRVAGGRDHPR